MAFGPNIANVVSAAVIKRNGMTLGPEVPISTIRRRWHLGSFAFAHSAPGRRCQERLPFLLGGEPPFSSMRSARRLAHLLRQSMHLCQELNRVPPHFVQTFVT